MQYDGWSMKSQFAKIIYWVIPALIMIEQNLI